MKKRNSHNPMMKRLGALALTLVMLLSMLPTTVFAAAADSEAALISTQTDPQTLTRPSDVYGNNTQNAGKITVGKSVSTGSVTIPLTSSTNQTLTASDPNNFMITVSQAAQVVGVTGETSVPVDVVFVLDTSRSMQGTDVQNLVTAANSAIATLMAANKNNRVAVVAFSGDSGQGTSNGAHANVLSQLAHYDDATEAGAASNHIRWVTSTGSTTGSNRNYIQGRGVNAGRRLGTSTGTNIHAGVALGGSLLANVPKAETVVDGVTRLPVMVIMSDGAPTNAAGSTNNENWYNPSLTTELSTTTNERDGKGFLAVMTAAYYKGLITEKYYGSSGSENNRCYIYTMGLGLSSGGLAEMTMDPAGADRTNSYYDEFQSYWNQYAAGRSFNVKVESNLNYPMTADSIAATKKYVNGIGLGYSGGMNYNDGYFSASQSTQLNAVFQSVVTEISKKSMSVPTMVTSSADFSGYVTFTDVLGEYMELKNMTGVVANGEFFDGASFARRLAAYGKTNHADNDPEFDMLLREVMQTRLNMSDSMKGDAEYVENNLEHALASENQAYWNSNSDYDNSLVWWGVTYNTGEEDNNIQNLGYADDDSILYIEQQKQAGTIPVGADCVVRSYFFYGASSEEDAEQDHEYLYFVVRVSRSLTAPYQQTVTISAPASLLSMDRVLIHEESDGTYTAEVEKQQPTRVVYEVGLRGDITPYNVNQVVSQNYKNESVNGEGTANYADGVYSFFTNDWDRSQSEGSHHRAMTKATFDAAADNSFYCYQENETLYVKNGNTYTKYTGATLPNGTYYYAREGYSWSGTPVNGKYNAKAETFYIKVDIEDDNKGSIVKSADNSWYIPAGLYTASTLEVNGDDVLKDDPTTAADNDGNITGTAVTVAHPHRTGAVNNSHYTVLLGNNGVLTMQAKESKEVSIDRGGVGTTIINNADGKAVRVGDVLTYTIEAQNNIGKSTDIVITDKVPVGTEFVSDENGGVLNGDTITWTVNDVTDGASASVSFKVRVTEAALASTVASVENQATVKVGNTPEYTTNTTSNPPEGKLVLGADADGKVQVDDELTYEVRYTNDKASAATITITDTVPAGTAYVKDSATHHNNANVFSVSKNAEGRDVLTWTLTNVQPGATGAVSFRVAVTAETIANNKITNTAFINDVETNTTTNERKTGNIKLTKVHTVDEKADAVFQMILTEATGMLEGTYTVVSDKTPVTTSSVTFDKGVATVEIKGGETLTIQGLPMNAAIAVREEESAGWTPTYVKRIGMVKAAGSEETLQVSNTYKATPVHFQLSASKTFVGAGWTDGATVSFKAEVCNAKGEVLTGDGARVVYATLTKGGDNTAAFKFSDRTFDSVQTLYYLISENVTAANKIANVDYDQTVYLLKLDIKDNGAGALYAETYYQPGTLNNSGAWEAKEDTALTQFDWTKTAVGETAINFTNTYYTPVELTISGGKTMDRRDMIDGEFVFELVDADSKVVSTTLKVNSDNKRQGTFTFAPITYTLDDVGTHTYTVREVVGTLGGVTYDTTNHTVTVTVSKDAATGQLTAVADKTASQITFANTYRTTYTTHAYYTPVANKTLNSRTVSGTNGGRDMAAGEFRFEVVELDSNNRYAPVQVNGADKVVSRGVNAAAAAGAVSNGWHSATGEIQFTPIDFTKHNVMGGRTYHYYYLIRENAGDDANVTYTTEKIYLRVTVYEDGRGGLSVTKAEYFTNATFTGNPVLTAERDFSGQMTYNGTRTVFTNYYGPGTVELNLNFNKKYNYKNTNAWIELSGSEFDFEVYAANNSFMVSGQPLTIGSNGATDQNGLAAIAFAPLHITKTDMGGAREKTFFYVVKELTPENADALGIGVASPIGVAITVQDDGYGNLTVKDTTYWKQNAQGAWEVQSDADKNLFLNTYNPASVTVRIPINKLLVGKNLVNETFTFTVTGDGLAQEGISTTTDADGLARFDLTFGAENMAGAVFADGVWTKEFVYQVKETAINVQSGADRYSMDATVYTVKVIVTEDGSGQLKAAAYVGDNRLEVLNFTNTYTPAAVTLDVDTVVNTTKTVVYPNGEPVPRYSLSGFTFAVKDAIGTTLSTGTSDAAGNVNFDSALSFTEARDYHFWIVEESSSADGITNDTKQWELHVVVDYDAVAGELQITRSHVHGAEVNNDMAQIQFVNTYEPEAEGALTIQVEKELAGRDLRAGEFRFQLMEIIGEGQEIIRAEVANGVPVGSKAPVTFHMNYTYADIGDHNYKIVEVKDGKHGVEYSDEAITLKVTVSDNKAGKLVAEIKDQSADVTITNKYTPDPVKLDIDTVLTGGATKTLSYPNGVEVEDYDLSKFTFAVLTESGADTGVVGTTISDGRVTFAPELVFTEAGEYFYTIKEKAAADNKVSIDQREWTLKVTVTYDATTGLLHIAETKLVEGDQPDRESITAIEFKNTYLPDDTTLILGAEKKLNGRDMKAGEFSFRLLKKNAQGEYELVEEVKNAAPVNGKAAVTFRALNYSYDDIGIHNYKIVEVAGTLGGVTYDTTEYEVEVVVTADYEAGKIVAVAEYSDDAIFVNTYRAADVEVPITVYKELTGRTLENGEFKFLLKEKVESAARWRYEAVGEAVANGAPVGGKAPVVFNVIYTPEDVGVHEYIIVEVNEGAHGVTYDTKEVAVKVTVTDDGSGQLKADVEITGDATFKNSYIPDPVTLDIDAVLTGGFTKELNYPNGESATGYDLTKFKFAVEGSNVVGTTDRQGKVTFAPELVFTEAGTYSYVIKETAFADENVTFDQREWKLDVVVSYNEATGVLSVSSAKVTLKGTVEAVNKVVFENTYEPADTTLTLGAEKELDGREIEAGEFSFRLLKKNAQGEYELVEEVVNAAPVNGKAAVTFSALTYTYADIGVHNYKIVEVAGTLGGVTYDTTEYEVEVVVTADYENGKIVAEAEYSDDAIFVNTYRAADVETPITVYKELTGRTLKSGEFKFLLKEKTESGTKWRYVTVGEVVSNGAAVNGKAPVVFNVTYTPEDVGVHEYIIVEEDNGAGGVTYDTKEIAVKVTVTDDGKGQLKAEVAMAENATFTNTYKANAVDVTLKATKKLDGRDMKAGEFAFRVYDSSDALVATGKNDAAGAVIFDTITFEQAGAYTLRVVEADMGDKEITYDDASYTVVVVVSDDGKGQLQAKVTYPDGDVAFVNGWEEPEVAPNTGDNFNAPLMLSAMICSAAAAVVLVSRKKKKAE